MVSGRLRTTTPPDEELVKLGEELLKWATADVPKKERPYRFRFAQWYSLKKGILDKEWDLMLQKPIFRGYYERARVALANRITDGTIKEGIAQRFMRTYCPEVKAEENETAKFKSDLQSKADIEVQMNLAELNRKIANGEISQK